MGGNGESTPAGLHCRSVAEFAPFIPDPDQKEPDPVPTWH